MDDTEWEEIANKLLDTLDANGNAASYDNTLDEPGSILLGENVDEAMVPVLDNASNSVLHFEESSDCDYKAVVNVDIRIKLEKLDPKYNLVIYRYLNTKSEDILVAEYCDKLIKLNFVPEEPSIMELGRYANRLQKSDLSFACQKESISMLVSYFKCSELKRKLKLAELERVSLFNVSTPHFMQSFSLFTIAGHERFATLRNCLCIQMQRAAALENQFVMELLLIRVCFAIMQDIQERNAANVVNTDLVMAYFMYLFISVKLEYTRYMKNMPETESANLKADEEYNIPDFPAWRIHENDPPMHFEKNLATEIFNMIQKSEKKTLDVFSAIEKLADVKY